LAVSDKRPARFPHDRAWFERLASVKF